MHKRTKKILTTIIVVFALIILALIGGGTYMLNYSLCPQNRGKNIQGSYDYMFEKCPYLESFVDSLNQQGALRDTFIYAEDGARLHAYYIYAPQSTRKTAVIVHGYTDNAIRMMMIGYLYSRDLAYNILLPDLRYSGESDGTYIQMG